MQPAIFLDRDGVINVDHGYVHEIKHFEFIPGVLEALKIFKDHGYLTVIITNQAGVAYRMYEEIDVKLLHAWMQEQLALKNLAFDGIYYCPHHDLKGVGIYKCNCNCRKPKIGLIEQACQDLAIDLSNSYMVGDRVTDVETGINAHLKGSYLVRTGKPITEDGQKKADHVFSDLLEFAQQIINQK